MRGFILQNIYRKQLQLLLELFRVLPRKLTYVFIGVFFIRRQLWDQIDNGYVSSIELCRIKRDKNKQVIISVCGN